MYSDLFSALLKRENPRGHPVLSALLYSFCPAAVRWWLAGADPFLPFDPVWQAMKDMAAGVTLGKQLRQHGLGELKKVIDLYVEKVKKYREEHKNILAPELLPFFKGWDIPLSYRFGLGNGVQSLVGDWRNLNTYVRTWAFLMEDWLAGMSIASESDYILQFKTVLLTLPEYRQPVHFDALIWQVPVGHTHETRIGLLVQRGEQDLLRFALLMLCSPQGDHPWPNLPQVYALDRETGRAEPAALIVSNQKLPGLVRQLSSAAKEGPYPPHNALSQPSICKVCGYQHLCYEKSNLSPHLLAES